MDETVLPLIDYFTPSLPMELGISYDPGPVISPFLLFESSRPPVPNPNLGAAFITPSIL